MEKLPLMELIQTNLASGVITKNDLRMLTGEPVVTPQSPFSPTALVGAAPTGEKHHFNISKLLYYIGGLIILIGIGVYVSRYWEDIGPSGRILISLGGAFVAYILGIVLSKMDEQSEVGSAFHLIGGVLFPFGAITLFKEMRIETDWATYTMLFGTLMALYAGTLAVARHPLVTFFVIVNGTAALFSFSQYFLEGIRMDDFYQYFAIVLGASYLYLGSQFIGTRNNPLCRMLFFVGSIWVLGGAFMLYGSVLFWELLYPLLVAGMMALSTYVKRMSILLVSTLALMAYIGYITGKYFADSVGWPLALIVIGLLFIAIGYFSFYLHGKYFK